LFCYLGNGKGDACDPDFDGDTVVDGSDVCPEDPGIYATNFKDYFHVMLDPIGSSQVDPEWEVLNDVRGFTFSKLQMNMKDD